MNFGYGYEREFKTFFTQKIKRIDLKERIYSPQKLKFQNETSIQESNIVANFCATVFVLERFEFSQKIPALGIFPCAGEIGFSGQKPLCWGFFPGGGAVRP